MLLHSREGSGERRSADINTLVRESLNLAYHGARVEKADFRITLKHDLDPEAGAVVLYPQEITRALLNLISNGFYAAARRKVEAGDEAFEPALSATTKNLGKTVEIRIRDNGTGIRPEVREKMFNPFFTTKPTGEGTGLGLSITHDIIVKQHSGRIDVETEPGVSTEFITLPRQHPMTPSRNDRCWHIAPFRCRWEFGRYGAWRTGGRTASPVTATTDFLAPDILNKEVSAVPGCSRLKGPCHRLRRPLSLEGRHP